MADETVRKLLIKLGISTSDWKTAVNDIKAQLNSVNEQAKKDAAQMKATQKEQLDLTKQQISEQQRLTAEARTLSAVDQAKAQWQKQQQEAIKTALQQRLLETAEAKKQAVLQSNALKMASDQVRLEQQKLRLAEQQRSINERQLRSKASESGGLLGGFGKVASTLAGGGLIGQIAGGALLGTGFAELLTSGAERIRDIAKSIVEATGPAAQLRTEFTRLASSTGQAPVKLLEDLRKATRGLVSDIDLYKVANNFMKSGLKLTSDQMIKLVSDTVNLGRSTGHTAQESTAALQRYFLTGKAVTLAQVTGIHRQQLAIRGLTGSMDPLIRRTAEFNVVSAAFAKQLERVGVPATTLPELFQQVSNAERNFIDDLGRGILSGGKFGVSIEELSQKLIALGPRLEEIATKLGGELATAISFIVDHLHEIKVATEAVIGLAFAKKLGEWALSAKELATSLGLLKASQEGIAAVSGARTAAKTVASTAGVAAGAEGVSGVAGAEALATIVPSATLVLTVGAVVAALVGGAWLINYLKSHPEKTSELGEGARSFDYANAITKTGEGIQKAGTAIAEFTRKAASIPSGLVQGATSVAADLAGGYLFGKQEQAPSYGTNRLSLALPPGVGPLTPQQQLATTHTPGYKPASTTGENNLLEEAKLREQRLKISEESSKLQLEQLKIALQQEQELLKRSYNSGLIALQDYINKQKALKNIEYKAELDRINSDYEAQKKNIKEKSEVTIEGKTYPTQSKEQKDNTQRILDLQTQNKQAALTLSHSKEIDTLTDQGNADTLAAAREHASELTRIAKESVQDQLELLEEQFKEGAVSADAYLTHRRALIEEELTAVKKGLQLQLDAAKDNEAEKQKISAQGTEAERQAARQRAKVDASEDEVRLRALQTRYQLQRAPVQTQVQLAKGDITGQSFGAEETGQARLLQLAQQHLQDLLQQTPKQGSDAWLKQQEDIAKTKLEVQSLSQELIKMQDISAPIGGIFGALSRGAGAIPRSRSAAGAAELFGNIQQSSQDISVFSQANAALQKKSDTIGGPSNVFSSLQDSFANLFKRVNDASGALEPMSVKLQEFEKGLSDVISGVTGVIKGVTSGKSGGSGALSGGLAGAQFGANFGLIGAAAGLVGGATFGAIFGSKEKQLQQDIHKVTTQLNSIISDLQAGTISLSQAIQDLRTERQQAIQLLSQDPKGGKGGGKGGKKGYTPSQAQAVIQQIDSQIQTLVNQQTQTLQSLSTSLEQVSNPQQYQEYLQTLTQIIQQYQTFASAAQGNAQEMTAANQYLNDSLNQYVVTLSQNLNQAQQTAINDALTLINLEYQRQQLINQEASQQYDILTQGVLTRQRTTAMTKGQEIGQIQYQAQMQMEQINEEISLQQYKVQTETQIFNLATTRIGLENQLLDAQEEQANYQILQVQALASVVSSLTSGLSSGQLTSQLTQDLSSGALPTESGLLYTLLELLGLSSNVPTTATQGQYGTTNWLAGIPASDASAAQYVASLDPNFPNLILSDQFAAAAADAQQYATQGEIDGYDMNDFIAWLQQQGQGAASGGDVTGPVAVGENGPEILMPGVKGTVLSNPIVTALNAMTGGGQSSNLGGGTSGMEVQTHQTLYDLTQQRTSMEMTVITARQSQIQNEMTLLQTYQDTFNNIANGSSPTQGLEDMVQKVWENRGRYGGANFRRQNI